MEEIDIWRAAEQMRKMFGAEAASQSSARADKLMGQGDVEGFDMWKRVAAAVLIPPALGIKVLQWRAL